MKIIAKGKNVIVKPEAQERKIGLIIIPETASEKKIQKGTIVGIGDLPYYEVHEGDKVIYSMIGVTKMDVDNEEVHIVPYDSFLIWAL